MINLESSVVLLKKLRRKQIKIETQFSLRVYLNARDRRKILNLKSFCIFKYYLIKQTKKESGQKLSMTAFTTRKGR